MAELEDYSLNKLHCQVKLEHSVRVTPQGIQVLDHNKLLYRITDDSQLFIDDKEINLTREQRALIEQYNVLIQELAPKISQLISQGLDVLKQSVTNLFNGIIDHQQSQQYTEFIAEKIEQRLAPILDLPVGEYFLSTQALGATDGDLSQVLEQEVKHFLSATSGQMLMLLGQVMMAGDTAFNDFEQRLKQFGQQLASDSQQLERQANQLCQKIERLDALESDLQRQIPRLANFDLVKIKFI
jgi:hypothetical protein